MKWGKAFRFHSPSNILMGLSGCGKIHFTQKLLLNNNQLFETTPPKIHYCYGAWQDKFKDMQDRGAQFYDGILDTKDLLK